MLVKGARDDNRVAISLLMMAQMFETYASIGRQLAAVMYVKIQAVLNNWIFTAVTASLFTARFHTWCIIKRIHVPRVMMTSSNARYWPFVWEIHWSPVNSPAQGPATRNFDVFFDLRLNKRLNKQSWGWWLETLSHPLWRHCNGVSQYVAWISYIGYSWTH